MSNAKGAGGHCLSDGSGRDSYAFLQQSTKAFVAKRSKWNFGPKDWGGAWNKTGGKPDEESSHDGPKHAKKGKKYDPFNLNEVWISETASDPIYIPRAKPYEYNCRALTRIQRDHDDLRVKERASDIARRQADIERRVLRAERLATCIPTVIFQKPPKLHRTFQPVMTAQNKHKKEKELFLENRMLGRPIGVFAASNQIAQLPSQEDHGNGGERGVAQRPASSAAHGREYSKKKRTGSKDRRNHEHHEKRRQRAASAVPSHRDRIAELENWEPGLGANPPRRKGVDPPSLTGRNSSHGHLAPISDNLPRDVEESSIAPRNIRSADPFSGPRLSRRVALQAGTDRGIQPYARADPLWVQGGWAGAGDGRKFRSDGEGEWVWMQVTPRGGLRAPEQTAR